MIVRLPVAPGETMLISAEVDPERVAAIHGVIVDAVDAWAASHGGTCTPAEVSEALLCDLCQIVRAAPDELTKLELIDNALQFVMRNAGLEPFAVLSYRASKRAADAAMAAMPAEGTA